MPLVTLTGMPRHGNLSFCYRAAGARMWMAEKPGTRINGNRTEEAVATGAAQIAVAGPFCRVMLSDALTSQQAAGSPTSCVPECTLRAGVLVSGPLKCTSERKADSGTLGGGGAGRIFEEEGLAVDPAAGCSS